MWFSNDLVLHPSLPLVKKGEEGLAHYTKVKGFMDDLKCAGTSFEVPMLLEIDRTQTH